MIEISEGAAKKIKSLMSKQGITDGGLRVGVKGGGCSGLSYTFLKGTTLDYDTALLTRGFVFHNPNATQSCGCGSSFGA